MRLNSEDAPETLLPSDSHLLASRSVGPFTCTLCGCRRISVDLGFEVEDPSHLYIRVYCTHCNNQMLVRLEEDNGSNVPGLNPGDAGASSDQ